ncbi:MAG: hypothetical protein E6Q97_12385 [Desulfurellales bacterium]|nr:MAG: hypothetical protein E6Q97_12385 [Desulfurellales bacterium]
MTKIPPPCNSAIFRCRAINGYLRFFRISELHPGSDHRISLSGYPLMTVVVSYSPAGVNRDR